MFVVASDFNRLPFNLTGLNKVGADFADFVTYYEEENLRELLGNTFYDALAAAFVSIPLVFDVAHAYLVGDKVVYVSGNVADIYICIQNGTGQNPVTAPLYWTIQPNDASKRWARLVFGDVYLYYNRPQKWYGMNRLVVPLIYALWTKYTYDNQTTMGVATSKKENSVVVSPAPRIARAMNKYADLCAGDWPDILNPAAVIWPELENSLFGYLYLNSATWDNLVGPSMGFNDFKSYLAYSFVYPGYTNSYGI